MAFYGGRPVSSSGLLHEADDDDDEIVFLTFTSTKFQVHSTTFIVGIRRDGGSQSCSSVHCYSSKQNASASLVRVSTSKSLCKFLWLVTIHTSSIHRLQPA